MSRINFFFFLNRWLSEIWAMEQFLAKHFLPSSQRRAMVPVTLLRGVGKGNMLIVLLEGRKLRLRFVGGMFWGSVLKSGANDRCKCSLTKF